MMIFIQIFVIFLSIISISSSEKHEKNRVLKTALQLVDIVRQDTATMIKPTVNLFRAKTSKKLSSSSSTKKKTPAKKPKKKPAKKPQPTYDYEESYDEYEYESDKEVEMEKEKDDCNFREACMDYFTILYLSELAWASSQADDLVNLNIGLNLIKLLGVGVNAYVLGGSNNGLSLYYSFCNVGDCYQYAMHRLAHSSDLDTFEREDIALGAKAGQLGYLADYMNETQPENSLTKVFQEADNLMTSQLSRRALTIKEGVRSRKCPGMFY